MAIICKLAMLPTLNFQEMAIICKLDILPIFKLPRNGHHL